VHFNKDKPENHNLLLTNLRSNIIKVLNDNNKWKATDLQEVIDYLIDKSTDIINNKYNKYKTGPDKCFKCAKV
jgi:predicted nucleic-acid-binding protein